MLPQQVLEQAQAELLDWNGTGQSVMEMSHRGKDFMSIAEAAEADLPLKATTTTTVQPYESWDTNPDAAYLHYTPNETIAGVEFPWVPETGDIPLVADMSSNILSAPIDVSKYGLIYAGAQKNIGPAGLTIVIIREDLIGNAQDITPTMLNYEYTRIMALCQGGLEKIETINKNKAKRLYDYIDSSDFYSNPVDKEYRSVMNIPFTLANSDLNEQFLEIAASKNLVYLKGHKSVGGMRASIYNAMPEQGVIELVDMMQAFEKEFG
ncbi:Phosphoserine aminotransferase [Nymphon striatum]|nr:Phosphoserine aminotransferase [Nymphon striatum]